MLDLYISILGLYIFALAGFLLKKKFRKKLDTKTLTLVTVYFMQPMLGFWGFTTAPLQMDMLGVGVLHLITGLIISSVLWLIFRYFTKDTKLQAILCFTGVSGNTGNMGIPIASILFGPIGIVVATMINFWNILLNFIFGVFFYARGSFSIKKALLEILRIPLLWACLLGIIINIYGITFGEKINYFLQLGAYCSIVMQLLLLGLFIASIEIKKWDWKISSWVSIVKFILMPLVGFILLFLYQKFSGNFSSEILSVALLQLFVPLATTNGNFSILYNCYPKKVSESILMTYVLFLLIVPILYFVL